jgi:hypothetical protein
LTLGVRYGHQRLYYLDTVVEPLLNDANFFAFPNVTVPGDHVESWSNLAPRLGFTYDLTGEGRTVLKAFFGRYYGQVGTGLTASNPAGQRQERYKWTDLNQNGFYDGVAELGEFLECFGVCSEGAGTPVASGTDLMYTDEISASVEHELAADTSLRFSYVRKQQRNRWGTSGGLTTVNLARATENLTQSFVTTCTDCPGGFEGTTLNLRTLPDGAPTSETVYANAPGDTDGNYNTFQVALNRRFRGGFFFTSSFDFQQRHELVRANGETTSPLDVDPLDRAWFPAYNSEIGQTQDSTNWNFRAAARYEAPREVGIAVNFRHQSGWPYAPIHRVSLPNVGTQPFFLEPIENNRSDNTNIIDIRVDKAFTFGEKYTATVMADVFNLTNSNAVTNFRLRTGSSYQNVIDWLGGRTLKLGVRFQF